MVDAKDKNNQNEAVTDNAWDSLRKFTNARIALGRAGISLPTKHLLDFQLAHARAQDAVHTNLDTQTLVKEINQQAWPCWETLLLHSQANHRSSYLQRPDLGRLLDKDSINRLQSYARSKPSACEADLAIVVVDGLSAKAIEQNAVPFLSELLPLLERDTHPWKMAPLCIVQQGRVAVGDQVAELFRAKCLILLVGERPGLSSPDSMGLYLTWAPKTGLPDSKRNCISNIRPEGIEVQQAAIKAHYLLSEARQLRLSGVKLKDRSSQALANNPPTTTELPDPS